MAVVQQKTPGRAIPTKPGQAKGKLKFGKTRLIAHLGLVVFSLVACGLAASYASDATLSEVLAIGTGYSGLLLIAITLLIGPINLFRKRRNPVNIDLRRDVGIWAGINTALHVLFGFQVFQKGQMLLYFLTQDNQPRFDIFGLSNDIGLVAFLVLIPILLTSNQIALRLLKGKRWKTLQRFTYLVFGLGIIHTIGYQLYNVREAFFTLGVVAMILAVLVAQTVGIVITVSRNRQRQTTNASPVTTPILQPASPLVSHTLARRQFVKLAGVSIISGVAVGAGASLAVRSQASSTEEVINPNAVAASSSSVTTQVPANTTTPISPTTEEPSTQNSATTGAATTQSGATGNTPATTAVTQPATTNPATTKAAATATATVAPPTGTVLTTVSKLAAGKALAFTTPDTGQSAFVVHHSDGSVTCFSGICTHEPVNLTYNAAQQSLYCPRHGVSFDTKSGAPDSPPARRALQQFKVNIDSKGNIIYG